MNTREAVTRDVLLGKRPWNDLNEAGWDIRRTRDGWTFGSTAGPPVTVAFGDLMTGMAVQLESEDEGREWARFVLAASDVFDLEAVSETGASEEGIEALWDLSRGDTAAAKATIARLDGEG